MEDTDCRRIMCNAAFFACRVKRQKNGGKKSKKVPVRHIIRMGRGKTCKSI